MNDLTNMYITENKHLRGCADRDLVNTIKKGRNHKNLLTKGCYTYSFFSPTYCIQLNIINYPLLYSNHIMSSNV